jgi:tetratricopeptide (TPR) repeat protein
MKALEKDRTRRYGSASAFAEDIRRYLNHDAVSAGKPGTVYKLRKFARRNKPMFATIGCVMAALLVGVAASLWQAVRAANEAERAQNAEVEAVNQAAIAEAINRFFNKDVLGQANPVNEPDPDIKLRTVLDRAAAGIEKQFKNQPLVEAGILLTIGETYLHLSEFELAEPHLDRALELRASHLGEEHPDTLQAKHMVASLHNTFRRDDAEALLTETLEARKRILGEEHPDTLESSLELSELFSRTQRRPEAEKLARKVFEASRRTLGENDRFTLNSMKVLATHLALLDGPIAEVERLYLETLRRAEQTLGESHHASLAVRWNLGRLYRKEGRLDEAQAIYEKALEAAKRNRPEDDFYVGYAGNRLASVFVQKGDLVKAQPHLEKALSGARRRFGDKDISTQKYAEQLARCYLQQGESSRKIEDLLIGFAAQAPKNWRIMRLLEAGVTQPSDSLPILPQYRSMPTGWRYSLLPPAENWFSPDYDDATWAAGATISGHPTSWGGAPDVWLRTEFSLESIPTDTLAFWTEFRDELQIYLNGKLVARSTDGDGYYRLLKLADEYQDVLRRGRNVIAVHARSLAGSARFVDVGMHVISDSERGERRFEEILTGFIQKKPSDSFPWTKRAGWRARHGRWKDALSDCQRAMEVDPSDHYSWFLAGHLLLQLGDIDQYRTHCNEMLSRFGDENSPQVADRVAKIVLLAPAPGQNLDAAARAAAKAVTSRKDDWTVPFAQMGKGLAELRTGNPEAAIEWCQRALGNESGYWAWETPTHIVVALARHQLGQLEDAERELAVAQGMIRTKLPAAGKGDLGSMWSDWIFCQQLLVEAEKLIRTGKN